MTKTIFEERNVKLAYKYSLQNDDDDSPQTPIKEALRSPKSKTSAY